MVLLLWPAPLALVLSVVGSVVTPVAAPFPSSVRVMSDGSETELWAAAKLASLLSLPLVRAPPLAAAAAAGGAEVWVGYGAATVFGAVPAARLSALGDDSYFLSATDGGSVAIASSAGSQRGSMNGIYAFLRVVGFRFLTHNATVVPAKPWSLPAEWAKVTHTFIPPMLERDMDTSTAADMGRRVFTDKGQNNETIYWPPSDYAAAVGLYGRSAFPPVGNPMQVTWGWGGVPNGGRAGGVATAYDLLSESLVADTTDCAGKGTNEPHPHNSPCLDTWRKHPDWFVCKNVTCDGIICPAIYPCTLQEVNRTSNSQPCWSVPSLQSAMANSVLRILRQNPNASSISVSGMDGSPVECPPDKIANQEEASTGGANFRAVKAIAEIVNKEFPLVKIQTLAYSGSYEPPAKLRFGPSVVVRLCIGAMNQWLPLSHPSNQGVVDVIRAWTKVAPTVTVWDYTYSELNNVLPWANYYTQPRHVQELVALGVKGYYGESMPHPGTDMVELKTYVVARTAFDPSLDTDALIAEFTDLFYSASAAPAVREYLGIMATAFNSSNTKLDYNGDPLTGDPSRHVGITNSVFGNHTLLRAATALVSAKAAAAAGEIYQLRLSQALMNVQWVILQRWDELQEFASANRITWPLSASKLSEFNLFAAAITFAFDIDEPGYDSGEHGGANQCLG